MNIMFTPFMALSSSTMILSTMMIISSPSWVFLWAALELNLLSFIPLLSSSTNNQETEGAVKYFLAQALGSAMLLTSSTSMWNLHSSLNNVAPAMLLVALLLKLGSIPCHFWYPSVMASISWMSCIILSTWQKLGPLSIILFSMKQQMTSLVTLVAGMNALVGGMMGMNQSQLRVMMAYSSIGHLGWMISLLLIYKPFSSLFYFMIYCSLVIPMFLMFDKFNTATLKQMTKIPSYFMMNSLSIVLLFMSLGGLPPLTGFMPKLMVIIMLTQLNKMLVMMLVIGSLMNLYFYLNIVISFLMTENKSSNTKQWYNISPNWSLMVTSSFYSFIGVFIVMI